MVAATSPKSPIIKRHILSIGIIQRINVAIHAFSPHGINFGGSDLSPHHQSWRLGFFPRHQY